MRDIVYQMKVGVQSRFWETGTARVGHYGTLFLRSPYSIFGLGFCDTRYHGTTPTAFHAITPKDGL